eukprot:CAMPEP_0198649276 /NCGR_PEP_ID=MMETSP1467-20131203/4143_1 /TAXON_ID=1462469 /ORGANISM="unid. sp., Strain CCMP2135" /LENGTH=69 /DNA_ID=CAMNT_0044385049 /DNA_START=82 /DNA_END=289 /DNA_ORIENTATION=+
MARFESGWARSRETPSSVTYSNVWLQPICSSIADTSRCKCEGLGLQEVYADRRDSKSSAVTGSRALAIE